MVKAIEGKYERKFKKIVYQKGSTKIKKAPLNQLLNNIRSKQEDNKKEISHKFSHLVGSKHSSSSIHGKYIQLNLENKVAIKKHGTEKRSIARKANRSEISEEEFNRQKQTIEALNRHLHHWKSVADERGRDLQAIYKSETWIITWPIRKVFHCLNWLVRVPKYLMRWIFIRCTSIFIKSPYLKMRIASVLRKHDRIYSVMKNTAITHGLINVAPEHQRPPEPSKMSVVFIMTPRAQRFYSKLKVAIEARQKDTVN